MLTFWIIAALFMLLALWFVLPPLLQTVADKKDDTRAANVLVYQDQFREMEADLRNGLTTEEQYQQDKDELERRLLEDVEVSGPEPPSQSKPTRRLAYGVATAIPIGAIAFYLVIGNPKAISSLPTAPTTQSSAPASRSGGQMSDQQIAANVENLAKRLEQNPNDAQGWLMLARSYAGMERFSESASAYARAVALNDGDASIWADYAEALALSSGRRLEGKPTEAINRALKIDPKNQKALALAGSAAHEAGEYQKAVEYWQRLLALLPPGSEIAQNVSSEIEKAKNLARDKGSK